MLNLGLGIGIPFAQPQGASFSPLSLPNLLGWYDASDAASITQASNLVSQWNDKSGNNNHLLQPTGANKFTTGLTTQNGLNILTAAGNGYMSFTSSIALGATSQYYFLVAENDDTAAGTVFLVTASSTVYGCDIEGSVSGGTLYDSNGTVLTLQAANGSVNILACNVNGSGRQINFNATTASDASSGARTFSGLCNYVNPLAWLDGKVGEVIIGNAALTAPQIASVLAYLKTKWGTP